MEPLPHPHNLHLDAAEGWLGLGNWREAKAELQKISARLRAHPLVLEIRYKILAEAGHWGMAGKVADKMREILPANPWGHFHLAYALHERKQTREAYEVVKAVVERFPREWLMRFNLACYACQLGNLEEAMLWLERANGITDRKDIQMMALADRDLQPLWPRIRKL